MEVKDTSSLFSLSVDQVTKAHLTEAAKWARFLAIVGFVFLGLIIAAGIFLSISLATSMSGIDATETGFGAAYGIGMAAVYLVLVLIWFFPLLFLLRFSNGAKRALAGNDQTALNSAFQNLKICFRYVGIITIIILAVYALVIVFAVITASAMS